MSTDILTRGHAETMTRFMATRQLETHGGFILPYLEPGMEVLDCGCGPGTITFGLAEAVFPGRATGLDQEAELVERASRLAEGLELVNASFVQGDAGQLPFADESFDFVFAHALLEHLRNPHAALSEMHRVLRPGGFLALCSPNWDRAQITPASSELTRAIGAYRMLQHGLGGDTRAGGKLEAWCTRAGFRPLDSQVRYEVYEDPQRIGDYLSTQLEEAGEYEHAITLRRWADGRTAQFTQAWSSLVALRE
jgi:SAM-dependent methyltransferase